MLHLVEIGQSDGDGSIEWYCIGVFHNSADAYAFHNRVEQDKPRPFGVIFRVRSNKGMN